MVASTLDPVLARAVCAPADCLTMKHAIAQVDARLPPDHGDRQPTSGSLRLRVLGEPMFDALREVAGAGAVEAALAQALGGARSVCLREQCWIRRQYPAALRPQGQHPHRWHQDGALGADFEGRPQAPLRRVATLWIALDDCGSDAPSLEWLSLPMPGMLHPTELDDAALAARWGLSARRHAVLSAGDALVFGPALVHRSHVADSMTSPRTSVELRFEPA
jgi:ectoine hydroxylase-related dioxygenase (phytanoyl-CoA dioxygenase family)